MKLSKVSLHSTVTAKQFSTIDVMYNILYVNAIFMQSSTTGTLNPISILFVTLVKLKTNTTYILSVNCDNSDEEATSSSANFHNFFLVSLLSSLHCCFLLTLLPSLFLLNLAFFASFSAFFAAARAFFSAANAFFFFCYSSFSFLLYSLSNFLLSFSSCCFFIFSS